MDNLTLRIFSFAAQWFSGNIGELALFFTLSSIITFGHYVIADSVKQSKTILVKVTRILVVYVSLIFFVISIVVHTDRIFFTVHFYNLFGLMVFVWCTGLLRGVLDHWDLRTTGRKTSPILFQNIRDTIWNSVVFLAIYASIMYANNYLFRWSGYLLCWFNIFRMIKYRFYDDFFLRLSGKNISVHGVLQNPGINLMQGLFNLILRSYLYITVSYGCVYTLMYFANQNDSNRWFSITNSSGSELFDFIYFSVITLSTVGYGDISPINWMPRLLSISEILIGYLFVGTLMALILNRHNPYADKT